MANKKLSVGGVLDIYCIFIFIPTIWEMIQLDWRIFFWKSVGLTTNEYHFFQIEIDMEIGPFEDVFPVESGDIPASYVSLLEGTIFPNFQ